MKKIYLLLLYIIISFSSYSNNNRDSIADAQKRAMDALKKLTEYYQKENKDSYKQDSINRVQDSLRKDSLQNKKIFEKRKSEIQLQKSVNDYITKNNKFNIYDVINYSTLLIIILIIYFFFRKLFKTKNITFKEFLKIWKKNYDQIKSQQKQDDLNNKQKQ